MAAWIPRTVAEDVHDYSEEGDEEDDDDNDNADDADANDNHDDNCDADDDFEIKMRFKLQYFQLLHHGGMPKLVILPFETFLLTLS